MVAAFATGDVADAADLVAPGYLDHQGLDDERPIRGADGFARVVSVARSGYHDLNVAIADLVEGADRVVLRLRWDGIRPTGEREQRETIDIVRVEDGRAVEHWGARSG